MIPEANEDIGAEKAVIGEVATFVRVARVGSLAAAARELGVPKSTISRRLDRLEARLGVKLVHRGSRKLTLTREGNRLFDGAHSPLQDLELAIHSAREGGTRAQGHIRITAPADFGRLLLLDELYAFAKKWPAITFEIDMSSRYVDIVEEGYDLAIRASSGSTVPGSKSLITRKLIESNLHIAGSADCKPVESLGELKAQPFVLFRQPSRRQTLELIGRGGRKHRVAVEGRFVVGDYSSMAQLVAHGAGFGIMPRLHIDHSNGALRCLLPQYCVTTDHIALVYPSRQLPRRVSLLIDHLTRRLGSS